MLVLFDYEIEEETGFLRSVERDFFYVEIFCMLSSTQLFVGERMDISTRSLKRALLFSSRSLYIT